MIYSNSHFLFPRLGFCRSRVLSERTGDRRSVPKPALLVRSWHTHSTARSPRRRARACREILDSPQKPEVWLPRPQEGRIAGSSSVRGWPKSRRVHRRSPPGRAEMPAALAPAPPLGRGPSAGVRIHTHVLFGRGNSYAGKVCCVIHENKYSEWKRSMLRESRLLSLTAWFRLGFPAAQYGLMESADEGSPGSAWFSWQTSGASRGAGSPRIAPTSSRAWGRAAPPLVSRSPRCESGSPPAPTSWILNKNALWCFPFRFERNQMGVGYKWGHRLLFLWRRTEQVIFTLCDACPDCQYFEATTPMHWNSPPELCKTYIITQSFDYRGKKTYFHNNST